MNNEPVAYVDKIWIERPDLVMSQQLDIGRLFMRSGKEIKNYIPLYSHPVKELDEDFDAICLENKRLQAEIEALKAGKIRAYDNGVEDGRKPNTHPVKEQDTECQYCKQGCIRCDARKQLTDEEMKDLIQEYWGDVHIVDPDGYLHEIAFIRAILRKAQEK